MKEALSKNGLILGGFALLTSGLIALTYALTKETIAHQTQLKLLTTLNAIVPENSYDNDIYHDCLVVNDPALGDKNAKRLYRARLQNKPAALAIEAVTPSGYNGNIYFLLSILNDGRVGGIRVLQHKETPGLGDKIDERVSDWVYRFSGLPLNIVNESIWAVKKDGGQFDQFTGATITPRAVLKGMRNTINYLKTNENRLFEQPSNCDVPKVTN